MIEFSIGPGFKRDERSQLVSPDRLSVIGYIGVWSNKLQRFPLPLLALDQTPEVTPFDKVTRVQGLLPSETDENYLVRGSIKGQVDITGAAYGEGVVYLGSATSPSNTYGVIFEEPIAFDPSLELGFVASPGTERILDEREFGAGITFLVYTETNIINGLGRVHRFSDI